MKTFVIIFVCSLLVCLSAAGSHEKSSSEKTKGKKIKYSYTIWIGNDVSQKYSLDLKSKAGIFFYNAMVEAAAIDSRFSFKTKLYPNYGRSVETIGDFTSDPAT